MNTFSKLASGVALSALIASGAAASDLNGLKDGIFPSSVNKVDFSGFYVGVGVGGEFANTELNGKHGGSFDGIGSDGLVGEGIVGYDIRRGNFVFGPRVIGGIGNVNTEVNGQDLLNFDGFVNLGGRAGIVFNRTLAYGHLGYEVMFASSDKKSYDKWLDDADLNAVTAGLGLETVISSNLSLAIEGTYLHGMDDADGTEAFRGMFRINLRQ